jgi:hypothetical protein
MILDAKYYGMLNIVLEPDPYRMFLDLLDPDPSITKQK